VTTPAIETIDLTKRFRMPRALRAMAAGRFDVTERVAVDDVSLSIPQGQVFGLLGQNGAGKTTLVRMLTTLLLPTSGTARIDGIDVARDPLAIRGRVGLVNGDERSFYWRLTGRQNLEFFAALRHLDRPAATVAIDRLATRLGMAEHIDRPFRMLSSGQRQALAIARGLLDEPSIVFMDEPTRSLDPISALRLRRFVADVVVGELGRTVVLATHSMPEAETLCDRLAFIQDGRIVASGSVAELRRTIGYGTRCELRLGDVRGDVTELIRGVPGIASVAILPTVQKTSDRALAVRLTMTSDETLPELLRRLITADISVLDCVTSELSLEEIYLQTLERPAPVEPRPVAVAAR
jgi:ABC-2 type transport system ATP-binding protein